MSEFTPPELEDAQSRLRERGLLERLQRKQDRIVELTEENRKLAESNARLEARLSPEDRIEVRARLEEPSLMPPLAAEEIHFASFTNGNPNSVKEIVDNLPLPKRDSATGRAIATFLQSLAGLAGLITLLGTFVQDPAIKGVVDALVVRYPWLVALGALATALVSLINNLTRKSVANY